MCLTQSSPSFNLKQCEKGKVTGESGSKTVLRSILNECNPYYDIVVDGMSFVVHPLISPRDTYGRTPEESMAQSKVSLSLSSARES
ncbi:hypothetical protein L596_005825 [Steinernema carpocapsae]|uniref:Uncharacterized protein n=1 Tax=Steinernema carpocapsae TaxID=34508 RepID=A0A4U8V092_STECR|nr:hypothetical protein L596_005825 [Steinernema carpocapsae]